MNLMENIWLKYQAISGRMWGRTAYYQTGRRVRIPRSAAGQPALARRSTRRRRGSSSVSTRGTSSPTAPSITGGIRSRRSGCRTRYRTICSGCPFVIDAYLQETGDDVAILDVREPFVDDRTPRPLYDHCIRAIDRALERFSPRGLPLIGEGDWNDGLSAVGLDMKGESVWLGHFLHRILLDFSRHRRAARGYRPRAAQYDSRAAALRASLNTLAWDGEYYFGATKDSGEKIGSSENTEGSRLAQSADVGDHRRRGRRSAGAQDVFDVVEKKLECEYRTPPACIPPTRPPTGSSGI